MKKLMLAGVLLLSLNLSAGTEQNNKIDFKNNTEVHYVKNNETLARIAIKNNVSVAFLLHINKNIHNPDFLRAGQAIQIPNKKIRDYVEKESKKYVHLIEKMGAMTYKERNNAIKEMIQKDWLAVPVLLTALDHKDVEIRENAREALREIHKKKEAMN